MSESDKQINRNKYWSIDEKGAWLVSPAPICPYTLHNTVPKLIYLLTLGHYPKKNFSHDPRNKAEFLSWRNFSILTGTSYPPFSTIATSISTFYPWLPKA